MVAIELQSVRVIRSMCDVLGLSVGVFDEWSESAEDGPKKDSSWSVESFWFSQPLTSRQDRRHWTDAISSTRLA